MSDVIEPRLCYCDVPSALRRDKAGREYRACGSGATIEECKKATAPGCPLFAWTGSPADEDEELVPMNARSMCACGRRCCAKRSARTGHLYTACAYKACGAFEWYEPDAPRCRCDKPAQRATVRKRSANCGRAFWRCDACNFFEWADASDLDAL